MIETDWKGIPGRLQVAGFTVFYERISYETATPLWRAHAHRDGHEWNGLGKDLETALITLEGHTHEVVAS